MDKIEEHEALDKILQYLVDSASEDFIGANRISDNVFPGQSKQLVFHLLKKLIDRDEIVTSRVRSSEIKDFDAFFEATDLTKEFLRQGGFTKEYNLRKDAKLEKERIEKLNIEKLEGEVEFAKFQKSFGKKLTIWGSGIATLAFVVSLIPYWTSNRKIDEVNLRIDSLTNRIDELEIRIDSSPKTDSLIEKRIVTTKQLPNQDVLS